MVNKSSVPVLTSDHASLGETLAVLQRRRGFTTAAAIVRVDVRAAGNGAIGSTPQPAP